MIKYISYEWLNDNDIGLEFILKGWELQHLIVNTSESEVESIVDKPWTMQ